MDLKGRGIYWFPLCAIPETVLCSCAALLRLISLALKTKNRENNRRKYITIIEDIFENVKEDKDDM